MSMFGNIGNIFGNAMRGSVSSFTNSMFGSKSEIDIYFQSSEGSVKIPINPPDLSIPVKYANKTTEIVALGQINVLGNPNLANIEIKSFFPSRGIMAFLNGQGMEYPPSYFVTFFQNAAKSKKPMKFIVTRLNISMMVSVEEFERKNEAGDHDDIYYQLKLKEYKQYGAIKLEFEKDDKGGIKADDKGNWIIKSDKMMYHGDDAFTGDKQIPNTVLNTTQGNLAAVSQKYTGSWDNWQDVWKENKSTLGDGLGDYFGQKMNIPEDLQNGIKSNFTK